MTDSSLVARMLSLVTALRESDDDAVARIVLEAAEALRSIQGELAAMREYAHEATKAITSLTGGGSEFFGREIGDIYTADLPRCVEHLQKRLLGSTEAKIAKVRAERERDEALAELAAMKKERDEARGRMDGQLAYSSDLQRIIEDLCNNRDIRKPETSARFHYDMAVASRASRDAGMSATDIDFSANIARVVAEESAGGAACGWRHCTGCYESEDGYAVGHYPFSPVFGCEVGAGCSECGGLGVIWHYYSAQDLDAMQAEALSTDQPRVTDAQTMARATLADIHDFYHNKQYISTDREKLEAFCNAVLALQEAPAPATVQRETVTDAPRFDSAAIMYSLDGVEPKPSPDGHWVRYSDHVAALEAASVSEAKPVAWLDAIRRMCGYVEDGSSEAVMISQDDATREWIVRVGNRWWHGRTMLEAIDAAAADHPRKD